ncbi:MAG: hypothetical protein ACR2IT_13300 [Pirellulales bacterium]
MPWHPLFPEDDGTMSSDETRVIPRKDGGGSAASGPRLVGGQIVFHCPAGHRIVVPVAVAGKRGTCSKCSVPVQIPEMATLAAAEQALEPAVVQPPAVNAPKPAPAGSEPVPPAAAPPPALPPVADEGDWQFISGEAHSQPADGLDAADWQAGGDSAEMPSGDGINPMAMMLARLWAERDHGGVIELHLAGGAVILPEEFSARWSGASHGLFASQAADGSVTLTAVAWDTVQRIVVRQLAAVPGDMFE